MKEQCKDKSYIVDEECQKCPYQYLCEKYISAMNDILYGN